VGGGSEEGREGGREGVRERDRGVIVPGRCKGLLGV